MQTNLALLTACVAFSTCVAADELRIQNDSSKRQTFYIKPSSKQSWLMVRLPPRQQRQVRLVSDDPFDIAFRTSRGDVYEARQVELRKPMQLAPGQPSVTIPLKLEYKGRWGRAFDPQTRRWTDHFNRAAEPYHIEASLVATPQSGTIALPVAEEEEESDGDAAPSASPPPAPAAEAPPYDPVTPPPPPPSTGGL